MTIMWILVALALIQIGIWTTLALGYRRVASGLHEPGLVRPAPEGRSLPPVSVVVAARNEETRLPGLIAAFDVQTHNDFEVLIVDDCSKDRTASYVLEAAHSRPWLRLVTVDEPGYPRKKNALTRGVEKVRSSLLAFTDADCRPGPMWLENLSQRHAEYEDDVILVGFAPYLPEKGWVSRMARYDATLNGFLTAATIGLGIPYMATGRNISYPRALFEKAGGHSHSVRSLSGDDDLFLQHVHSLGLGKIVWLGDPDTFVPSRSKTELKAWLKQKRRHTSAGRYMKPYVKVWGSLFYLSLAALWLAPFLFGWIGLGLLIAWIAAHYLAIRRAFRDLLGSDLLRWFLFQTLLTVIHYVVFPVTGFLFPTKKWN